MLNFRQITENDFYDLCTILQDKEIMYAWEHAFSDSEVHGWIVNCRKSYIENNGLGYLYVTDTDIGRFIGMMGLLKENVNGINHIGLGYILDKKYWGKGYAVKGAEMLLKKAFYELNADKVIAEIRPENTASRKVAKKLGMKIVDEFIKHYNGKDMLHLIYCITKEEFQ